MKRNVIMEAMPLVEDNFIAEASPLTPYPMKRIRRNIIGKYVSVAAGLCAILFMGSGLLATVSLITPEIHLLPQYSADEIAGIANGGLNDGTPTNAYETVYAPMGCDPTIVPIQKSMLSKVYSENVIGLPLHEKSITDFTDGILTRLSQSLGVGVPDYPVEKKQSLLYGGAIRVNWGRDRTSIAGHTWDAEQTEQIQTFDLLPTEGAPIILNGLKLEVDFSMTDEEILDALSPIRDELFSIFGTELRDYRVIRNYNSYDQGGASRLTVYFYNETDHPLNPYLEMPRSDYIAIHARRNSHTDDPSSASCSVSYCQFRIPAPLRYTVKKLMPTVSLDRAEELLAKGYVFGGHSCELCMKEQKKIDFESYDYVGMTYHYSTRLTASVTVKEAVPFYAFYKKLEDTENGLTRFAVTYVPAVEVWGYEDYFENQTVNHRSPVYDNTVSDEPEE